MKTINLFTLCVFALALSNLWFAACATQKPAGPANSADSITLDTAITEAASYFTGRLPSGTKLAVVPFDAATGRLSDYVFEDIRRGIVTSALSMLT